MKKLYWLLPCLLTVLACKKDKETGRIPVMPIIYNFSVAFSQERYGPHNLLDSNISIHVTAAPGTQCTYEIAGELKGVNDVPVKGTATMDQQGKFTISANIHRYKDGELIVNVKALNTIGVSDTTKKEELVVANYKDLLSLYMWNPGKGVVYVQSQDFAFPDTVLTSAPVFVGDGFKGVYDGQGHKITNLTIITQPREQNPPSFSIDVLALFAILHPDGVIKNVRLELSPKGISSPNIGLAAGICAKSGGTIINCSVKGNILSEVSGTQRTSVGGIAGECSSGTIFGCSFVGKLQGSKIGGITADIWKGQISACYSSFTGSGDLVTAGLVAGYSEPSTIKVQHSFAWFTAGSSQLVYPCFFMRGNVIGPTFPIEAQHCYGNTGMSQTEVAGTYSTIEALNTLMANKVFDFSDLPAGITPPPGNKPFKVNPETGKPPLLWWE